MDFMQGYLFSIIESCFCLQVQKTEKQSFLQLRRLAKRKKLQRIVRDILGLSVFVCATICSGNFSAAGEAVHTLETGEDT